MVCQFCVLFAQESRMNKLLATIVLFCFSLVANGQENVNLKPKNLLSLFCSETNNKDYQYLIFMIAADGWIYDAIMTKKARFQAYGSTPYAFQTLSPIPTKSRYFQESWVHQTESEYTLLTASNYSREFVIDLNEMKFWEIESGVENKNLSGTCANTEDTSSIPTFVFAKQTPIKESTFLTRFPLFAFVFIRGVLN